ENGDKIHRRSAPFWSLDMPPTTPKEWMLMILYFIRPQSSRGPTISSTSYERKTNALESKRGPQPQDWREQLWLTWRQRQRRAGVGLIPHRRARQVPRVDSAGL